MNETRSQQLFTKAKNIMPGGVNSPVRAFQAVGGHPFFVERAQGPWLFDVDGNRYLDYVCSWGPGILGHAHPRVIEAVRKVCESGLTFGAPTAGEVELAELISVCVPDVEMVRLVSSGTEAVMSAVRAARGFTGKEKIIKFAGNYHGHSDGLLVKAGSGLMTQSVPDSAGVPAGYAASTLTAVYNDENSVRRLMEENSGQVAAIVVEPVAANMGVVLPKKGFLEFLRAVTKEQDALLIFDEVITGFRLGLGGATEYTGVHADLHTFGKIVGGGMPLAAYGGRRDIMSCVAPLGAVYQAGTLSGNPVAVTAGITTLKILMEDTKIYERLDKRAARLAGAYREAGLTVNRAGSLLSAFFVPGWRNGLSDCRECADAGSEYVPKQEEYASAGSDVAPGQNKYASAGREYAPKQEEYASAGSDVAPGQNKYASTGREYAPKQEEYASAGKDYAPDRKENTRKIENYEDACRCDRDAFAEYFNRMLAEGIYVAPSQFEALFVSDAHSQELIDRTCAVITESIRQMKHS